jgi:hypothetical protein
MKAGNTIKERLNFAVAAAIATVVFSHQLALAAETPRDVSKEISGLRSNVMAADVYVLPDGVSFRRRQEAPDVVRSGCSYRAVEQADVDSLLDVLVGAGFHEQPPQPSGYETRLVVHLRMRDGGTIPLALTRQYSDAAVSGTYQGQVSVVAATMGFGGEFGKWKAQRKPDNPEALMCKF